MKYRIITNGTQFRVQRKSIFGWWTVKDGGYYPQPVEFGRKEFAENWIRNDIRERTQRKIDAKWRVA